MQLWLYGGPSVRIELWVFFDQQCTANSLRVAVLPAGAEPEAISAEEGLEEGVPPESPGRAEVAPGTEMDDEVAI